METIDTVELRRQDEEATPTERAVLRLKSWPVLLEHIDAQAAEIERRRAQAQEDFYRRSVLSNNKQRIDELLEDAEKNLTGLAEDMRRLQADNTRLTAKLEAANSAKEMLENDLFNANGNLEHMKAEYADVREQLSLANAEIGDLTVELDEAQHPWRSFWRWLVALFCGRGCGWSWR